MEDYMRNNELLQNLSRVFEQRGFMTSEEMFMKIVDMAAEKLLKKETNHEEFVKKIINDKMQCRHTPNRKFKRINKRIISKKKLRQSVINKISISNKQIHQRYEEEKAKSFSKPYFQGYIHRLFGVPMYSDQEEEKQQLEGEGQKMNQMPKTKRDLHQMSKDKDFEKPSLYKDSVQKRFKKVHTNFQNYIKAKQKESKPDELTCPICIEILIEPVSTVCGHTFCYSCLDESLLFTHTCPVCRFHIKGIELVPCNRLSELIRIKCEGKSMTPEQTENYHHRKKQNQKWREKRSIKVENINLGSPIDVRDTENIWCAAIVLNVFQVEKRISSVLVHYLQWADLYNEVIEIKSGRLAPWGCFTKRADVPRYNLHQESENLRGTVVNGIQNNQQEIIRPERDLSIWDHLRDLQSTVNTFRSMAFRAQPVDFINQNNPNMFIMQNPFDAFNSPDEQSSQSASSIISEEPVNNDSIAEQQIQFDSPSLESMQLGLVNSNLLSSDNSPANEVQNSNEEEQENSEGVDYII